MRTNVKKPKSLEAKPKHAICSFTSSHFFFVPSSFASVKFLLHLSSAMHTHSGRLLSLRRSWKAATSHWLPPHRLFGCASAMPRRLPSAKNQSERSERKWRRSRTTATSSLGFFGSSLLWLHRGTKRSERSRRKQRQSRVKTLNWRSRWRRKQATLHCYSGCKGFANAARRKVLPKDKRMKKQRRSEKEVKEWKEVKQSGGFFWSWKKIFFWNKNKV